MTIERDVRARLDVEATGDKGAFREAAEDAGKLEEAAGKATPTLDQTRQKLAELRETLQNAFKRHGIGNVSKELERAKSEVGDFLDQVEEGAGGVEEVATRARLALSRLQEAQAEQAREGRRVTRAQREEIEGLEESYKKAIRGAGEFKRAQIESTREIDLQAKKSGELGGSISSLGDLFTLTGSKSAAMAVKVGAGVGAFSAGFEAGTRFRDILKSIDQEIGTQLLPTLDNFVQKSLGVQSAMDRLFGASGNAAQDAERLQNNLKILAANGIKPLSTELSVLDEQVAQLARQQSEARGGLQRTIEGYNEWRKSLGLLPQDLDKASTELAEFVELLLEQNEGLDKSRIGEKLKPQIEQLIESYQALGKEVPAEIQKVVAELGLLESGTQESLEKGGRFLDEYRTILKGTLSGVSGDVEERAKDIQAAFAEIDFQEFSSRISTELPEAKDALARRMEEMIAIMRAAGVEVTDEAIAIAKATGAVIPSFEPVRRASDETSNALDGVEKSARGAGAGAADAKPEIEGLGTASGSAAGEIATAAESLDALGKAGVSLKGFLESAREEIRLTLELVDELEAKLIRIRDMRAQGAPAQGAPAQGAPA